MKKWLLGILIIFALLIYFLIGFDNVSERIEDLTYPVVDAIEEEVEDEVIDDVDDADASLLDLPAIVVDGNGTEPFWNFTASGTTLVFNEPSMSGPLLSSTYTIVMTQNVAGTELTLTHPAISIVATLGACSDGMSDISYGYSTVMTRSGDVWNGCANVN